MLLKRIDGFNGYWISLNGSLWSDKKHGFKKPYLNEKVGGYLQVRLMKGGKQYTKKIHRLVCEAFNEKNNLEYNMVDHMDRNTLNNEARNLRWCNSQMNNQNRINNNQELNIYKRKDGYGFAVEFRFKKIRKNFKKLEDAVEFRDIIQDKINKNEAIDPIYVMLFKNEMKYILKRDYGAYQVSMENNKIKFHKTYKTLTEAIQKRDEILQKKRKIPN